MDRDLLYATFLFRSPPLDPLRPKPWVCFNTPTGYRFRRKKMYIDPLDQKHTTRENLFAGPLGQSLLHSATPS